jgi:hypothetical protein
MHVGFIAACWSSLIQNIIDIVIYAFEQEKGEVACKQACTDEYLINFEP